jgi:secreted PhoX family phosphatase
VYFTTKGDNRVWDLDTREDRLTVLYDAALDPTMQLTGVDNVTAGRSGDLLVAEDGGNMELVIITPGGVVAPLLRVVGQDGSELTGPAFDPTGRRLYVSSQRGAGLGITYEIAGPFRRRAV